jgi:hypothetical protein
LTHCVIKVMAKENPTFEGGLSKGDVPMNRKINRRVKGQNPKRVKRSYPLKAAKRWVFQDLPFAAPELRWVDAVLRSFQEEAPSAWVPFPYQAMLKKYSRKHRKPRVLH